MIIDKCKVTKEESQQIIAIMLRAASIMNFESRASSRIEVTMDLTVCHALACPLDLGGLLKADPADLVHDISGILAHLNRETGVLEDCFTPRYARANHV
jgi:hypothetical protein